VSHPVLADLAAESAATRRAACRAAAQDPAAVLLVDALAGALDDPDVGVARAAADALAAIGRTGGDVLAPLRRVLREGGRGRGRVFAACALARLEPPGPRLVPALVEGLRHPEGDVRWAAARVLVDAGRLHDEVLGLLLGLVRGGDDPGTRRMAAFALRELAPDRPEAAGALLEASRDADVQVRRAALTAMTSLMDPPEAVRRRLAEVAAGDADGPARRIAGRALELLEPRRGGSPA